MGISAKLVGAAGVAAGLLAMTALTGCQTLDAMLAENANPASAATSAAAGPAEARPRVRSLHQLIPADKINTDARKLAAEGIALMDEGKYEDASARFNQALKVDLGNSYLHFLNGLAYHYRALKEESQLFDLAIEGYMRALKFDRSNWFASYYLGQAYMDQRQFQRAKANFEAAAIYAPKDPDVLYGLASASYYAHDPRTAEAALGQLRTLDLGPGMRARVIQASAITSAALNRPDAAQKYVADLENLKPGTPSVHRVASRVAGWKRIHQIAASPELAQFPGAEAPSGAQFPGAEVPGGAAGFGQPGAQEGQPRAEGEFVDDQMAVVDVTIIRTEEDISSAKGVNLLSGLQLQFGNPTDGIPGFSLARNTVFDRTGTSNDAVDTQTITSLIRFPGVTYSLNIANSRNDRNEVLARPTLVARAGQTSDFFSGVEVAAAATSGGAGDSVSIEKEVGVKLAVTPEFLPDDRVLLQVKAQRTFLTTPSRSVEFEFRLDTSKTTVNANVAMKFGQTLILSGLSERETESTRDSVPFLEEIPGIQYFFARASRRNFRKSVLILLTPRRTQYLYADKEDIQKQLDNLSDTERERSLFERRFADWFQPLPHTAHIFEHFKSNRIYQDEFRTGDFPLIDWNGMQTHDDRMKAAQQFLYY